MFQLWSGRFGNHRIRRPPPCHLRAGEAVGRPRRGSWCPTRAVGAGDRLHGWPRERPV